MTLVRGHRIVGLVGLVLFISTGIYMRLRFPALYEGRETVRVLFRSNHIYLLFASLVNLALSLGVAESVHARRRLIQRLASIAVMGGPAVLFAAFFIDPPQPDADRIPSRVGVLMTAIGVVTHVLAARKKQPPV